MTIPDYVFLEENIGNRDGDLGAKPFAKPAGSAQTGRLGWIPPKNPKEELPTGEVHYPVVLSNDYFIEVNRLNYIPPEEVENTIFGYPVEDRRFLILADTNNYGIDPSIWSTDTSLSNEDVLPNVLPNLSTEFWVKDFSSFNGVPAVKIRCSAQYGEIESYPKYVNTSIELTVAPNSLDSGLKSASCTTKQVFDCEVATNLFISFGLVRINASNSAISKAGIFSNKTGWYIEIVGNGEGDNFRIVRRYTDLNGQTQEVRYFRNQFIDRLNGLGSSKLNIRFDYVTMFGIEIGSYDGTASAFYVYAADAVTDSHRWIKFHKISTSETGINPERNASSLPVTITHEDTGQQTTPSIFAKYGTSVTKAGVKTTPTKIFTASGQFQELVAEKEVFVLAVLTKDLYNDKNNYTKHLPKYINVNSNVPTELVIRRYFLNENSIKGLSFKSLLQEEYDVNNLLYVIAQDNNNIQMISPILQTVVKSIKVSARNIYYSPENKRLYATQTNNNDILVIDSSTGSIIAKQTISGVNSCDDIVCAVVTENNTSVSKLFVSHTSSNKITVLNATNENFSTINTLTVTSPTQMTVGATNTGLTHVFVANSAGLNAYNASSTGIDVVTVTDTPSSSPGIAVAHNFSGQDVILLTSNGKMLFYDLSGSSYVYNATSSIQSGLISGADNIEIVDTINYIYIGSSTANGYNLITYNGATPVIATVNVNYNVLGIGSLDNLDTYVFNTSPIIRELLSNTVVVDLSAPTSFLKGNLLASGISALTQKGLELVGDRVASFITGSKPKQINVVNLFHENREFFSSTYKNFGLNPGILGQDLVLFYLKNVGELLSKHEEDVIFNELADSQGKTNYTSTTTNYHFSNIGSGTISLVTGQT